nr:hypothetical protein [Brevibacillus sp. HB1.2]
MKKYARYAAYTLAVIMLGATITLLLHGDMTTVAIPFVLLLVFLLIGRQSGSKKQPNNATPI